MKVEQTSIKKIQITDIKNLDPVSVYLEDFEPRKGKITISCWDKSWHSYWGGMGDRTISEFFLSCDNHYIAKNLSSINSSINDYEALSKKIKDHYGDNIDYFVLDEMSELDGDQSDGESWVRNNAKVIKHMMKTFGIKVENVIGHNEISDKTCPNYDVAFFKDTFL